MKIFKNSAFWWDLFFTSSILGIWPRYVEPNLLSVSRLTLRLPNLLSDLRILQISDLHIHDQTSERFLRKIERKANAEKPDLIFFTGDFICRSKMPERKKMSQFFNALKPSLGSFAVLGNHDYSQYVSINQNGDYDVFEKEKSQMNRGFKRFFSKLSLTTKSTQRAKNLNAHHELVQLLQECGIQLLDNASQKIGLQQELNVVGLGEHMLDKTDPEKAFKSCDPNLPTFVLVHNPDAIPKLSNYPGNLILSGHTHGGQINLPWVWKNVCLLENQKYKRGLFEENGKWIYINRGVGGSANLRLFSVPEITSFTLKG